MLRNARATTAGEASRRIQSPTERDVGLELVRALRGLQRLEVAGEVLEQMLERWPRDATLRQLWEQLRSPR